jgi:peptide/nickel transport system substrate-binding protein
VDLSVWADKIGKDGIPLTSLYFAPDHTDTSQYIQYFAMVPNSQWSTWAGGPTPIVDQSQTDLLTKAFAAPDMASRGDIYKQLGQKMIDDAYILPVVNPDLFLAYQSNITGMAYSACCNLELGSLGLK